MPFTQSDMRKLLEVSAMLTSERDIRRLLNHILTAVMEITRCDAGTLYIREGDFLRFAVSRNNTLKNFAGEDADPDLPPVPLTRESVCALSLIEDTTIREDDVRHSTRYDFTGPIRYDAMTGYYTKSMLVTPVRSRDEEAVGVLQLINAMDENGEICPFSEEMILLVEGVSAQAALAIQNARYIQEIRTLIRSFVQVMSAAVDERSPYNGNHTRHMAAYGDRFVTFLNTRAAGTGGEPPFTPEHREELLMSVWLHDIGKLVIPLEVMDKADRLLPEQRTAFLHRMETVRLLARLDCATGALTREEADGRIAETHDAEALVDKVNSTGFVTDELLSQLQVLRERPCVLEDGSESAWLTEDEFAMLSIRKGTLSAEERHIIESHVSVTDTLLSRIRFPKDMSHVHMWASEHHEFINGTGYPRHLEGEDVPFEARIITILDIFDALTASDRPYKKAKTPEEALNILDIMAKKEGKIDPEVLALFVESRCWEEPGEG